MSPYPKAQPLSPKLDNYKDSTYGKSAVVLIGLFLLLGLHPPHFYREISGTGLITATNNVTWITVSIFILLTTQHIRKTQNLIKNRGVNILLITLIPLTVPLYYGNSDLITEGALRVLAVMLGVIVIVLIVQLQLSSKTWGALLACILISVSSEGLYGLYQYHIATPGSYTSPNINIPYGNFRQYNIMGVFMATGVACAFTLLTLLYREQRNSNHFSLKEQRSYLLLTCTSTIIAGWIILLVLSRTSYLALGLVSLISLFAFLKGYVRKNPGVYFFLALCTGVLIGIIDNLTADELFRTNDKLLDPTGNGRTSAWAITLNLFTNNPVKGIGYGDFRANFIEQNAYHYIHGLPVFFGSMSHPHNELLYWAVEGGIIPVMGLIIGLVCFIFFGLYKQHFHFIYLLPLIPMGLHTQLELPFYTFSSLWILFCILLAFTCQQLFDSTSSRLSQPSTRLYSLIAALFSGAVITLLALNLQAHYHYVKFVITEDDKHLNRIIWHGAYQHRIDTENMVRIGKKAILEQDSLMIALFIHWADGYHKIAPNELIYRLHYEALMRQGDKAKAISTKEKALYLFPTGLYFNQKPSQM